MCRVEGNHYVDMELDTRQARYEEITKKNHKFTALSLSLYLPSLSWLAFFHRIKKKQVSSNMHGTLAITCGK